MNIHLHYRLSIDNFMRLSFHIGFCKVVIAIEINEIANRIVLLLIEGIITGFLIITSYDISLVVTIAQSQNHNLVDQIA